MVNWHAYNFKPFEGYGRHGNSLTRELLMLGVPIRPVTYEQSRSMFEMPVWMRPNLFDDTQLTISFMTGDAFPKLKGRHWGYTMWETDKLPSKWVANINKTVSRLLVPCEPNKEVFEQSGVSVPITVVDSGIDPIEFPICPPRVRQKDEPFTIMILGDRGGRKGISVAWQAFFMAFQKVGNVRLIVKSTDEMMASKYVKDPRITFWGEKVDSMSDVYRQVDCFLFPSFGEGYGLPPREAAAMGVPVIVPRHTGLVTEVDEWATRIIEKVEMKTADPILGGNWYVPDLQETMQHLSWVYENEAEAKQIAQEKARWLHSNRTWSHAAQAFKEVLDGTH